MSHLIRRSKQLFIASLFALAVVTTLFSSPQPPSVRADADPTPTATPTEGTEGWTDPIGG